MNDSINIVMLLLLILFGCTLACIRYSPDALNVIARKMRARARAMRAADVAYKLAYSESLSEDIPDAGTVTVRRFR